MPRTSAARTAGPPPRAWDRRKTSHCASATSLAGVSASSAPFSATPKASVSSHVRFPQGSVAPGILSVGMTLGRILLKMPFLSGSMTMADAERVRTIGFLNWAHAIDHFVLLIYPTVVIGLEVVYGRSYPDLIALSTASFVAFGVFSLPAGWLADRWSR